MNKNTKGNASRPKRVRKMNLARKSKYAARAVDQKSKITDRVMKRTGFNIKGRGAYSLGDLWNTVTTPFRHEPQEGSGRLNNLVRGGAEALGKELTGSSTVGRYMGNAASWLTKLMGSGTYAIKGNTLMDPNIATFRPSAATVISHREFVADISGSTGFANQTFLLNPGNALLFPWLSTLALNYEQYEWLGLAFEFRSTCAFTSATGNLGAVIMATDYDVLDSDFTSKRAMEIADFSGSSSPVNSFYHFVECEPQQSVLRQMYVQQGNNHLLYPDDPRFSIPGRFQLGTQGMPSAFIIGELWVTYHVKFMRPTIAPTLNTSQSLWARYQSIILPSVVILPVTMDLTGGTSLGVVSPWTKSPATYVTGFSFTGFAAGNYLATIVSKINGSDLGTTVDVGALVTSGGALGFVTGYNGAGLINTENLDSHGQSSGGYVDTKVGCVSFTMTNASSFLGVPFTLWDLRNNGVTIIVTKLTAIAEPKKRGLDQRIQTAVRAALSSKDEVCGSSVPEPMGNAERAIRDFMRTRNDPVHGPDEESDGETPDLENYCQPPKLKREATSSSSSSSSIAIGSRSGSKK
jgi:hypothetical protein